MFLKIEGPLQSLTEWKHKSRVWLRTFKLVGKVEKNQCYHTIVGTYYWYFPNQDVFFKIFCSLRSLTSFYIDAELSEYENRLADPAFCEDEWMWTDMILGGGFQVSFLFSPLFALKWSNLIDIFSDGLKPPPSEWLKFFPSVHAHKCRRHFDHPLVTWSLGGEKLHGLARRPNLVMVWK